MATTGRERFDILICAGWRVFFDHRWVRCAMAATKLGAHVDIDDPEAYAFCAVGAIQRCAYEKLGHPDMTKGWNEQLLALAGPCEHELRAVLGTKNIVDFNDEIAKHGRQVSFRMWIAAFLTLFKGKLDYERDPETDY